MIDVNLGHMTTKELQELQGAVGFWLKKRKSSDRRENTSETQLVYDCLRCVLKRQGMNNFPPFAVFEKNKYFNSYIDALPIIDDFFEEYFPKIRKIEKIKLLNIFLGKLVSMLRGQRLPITVGVLAVNVQRLPEAIEDAFPGYAEAGIMSKLIDFQNSK